MAAEPWGRGPGQLARGHIEGKLRQPIELRHAPGDGERPVTLLITDHYRTEGRKYLDDWALSAENPFLREREKKGALFDSCLKHPGFHGPGSGSHTLCEVFPESERDTPTQ